MDVFRILKEDISALSLPELHDDVSEDTLTHLDTLAKQADATELALSYMMRRSFSIQKLYEKLLKNGVLAQHAKAAVRKVVQYGYLREHWQIKDLISRYLTDKRGPAYIHAKLRSAGYRMRDIEQVEREMEDAGELDYDKQKKQIIADMRAEGMDELSIQKKLKQLGFMPEEEL